jgi:hypothetical protein
MGAYYDKHCKTKFCRNISQNQSKHIQLYLSEYIYKLNRRCFGKIVFHRLVISGVTTNGH